MSTTASGTFGFKDWQEAPYSEGDGGLKLARAGVTHLYTGEIAGQGTAQFLMVYLEDGTGQFVGLEHVVGALGGRSGSVVLRHDGTFDATTVTTRWTVVPGSGTGDLRGLTGAGGFTARHGQPQTAYTFSYTLP